MANKNWFSARLLFFTTVNGHEDADPLCEESIILVHAENESSARKSATCLAAKMEHGYENGQAEPVEWKFAGIVEVQDIFEESIENGTEVFSQLFWKSQAESTEVRELLDKQSHSQTCKIS